MRYLPHTPADRQAMLAAIGVRDIDDLFVDVPDRALLPAALGLPSHAGEMAVEQSLAAMVAMLTGMDVANASMYDGASSCAEAVLMARRVTKRNKAILCGGLHPHYRDAAETVTQFIDFRIDARPADPEGIEDLAALIGEDTACVVVQTPDLFGRLHDLGALSEAAHAKGALLIAVVTEAVSLGAVTSPGEMP